MVGQSAQPTRQQVGLGTIVFTVLRRIRELELMAPEFVFYLAAASGTGLSRRGSRWVWALSCLSPHEEFGSLNLWLPNSCSIRRQQVEPGTARRQQVGLGTIVFTVLRRIREVQFMLPEFVFYSAAAGGCRPCRPGGSRWQSALPTGSKWVWALSCLSPHEEFGSSNLWLPNSCSIRRQQVEPGTARR